MSFAVISPSVECAPRRLVGRERELRWVAAGLRTAERGAGALIAVEGRPGTGKSCLFRDAQRQAAEDGMLVLATRALEGEHLQPHALLQRLCAPLQIDPSGARRGLAEVVGRLAGERPLLIAVDDVDRSDRESLRALAALALGLDGVGGAALLVTRRYDAPWCVDPGALDALVGDPAAIRIRLGPVDRDDSAAIVEAIVSAEPEAKFAATVHELTAGNPFLVSELALALGERGIAPVDANVPELSGLTLAGVARSVRARAVALGADREPLLGALAVLGEDATLSAAASLTSLSYVEVADRCGDLVTAGVLATVDPPQFAQPLLRTAIYEAIATTDRLRMHAAAARALAGAGTPIDGIAQHLLAAGPTGDSWAARTLRTAARAAGASGHTSLAREYLVRALGEGTAELRPALERQLGLIEAALGSPGAEEQLRRAYRVADSANARAQIALALARLATASGARTAARDWCLTGLEQLPRHDDPDLSARLCAELTAVAATDDLPPPPAADANRAEASSWLELAVQAHHACVAGLSSDVSVELARRALASPNVWHERGSLIPHLAIEVLVAADLLPEAKATWDAGLAVSRQRGLVWETAAIRAHRSGTLLRLGWVQPAIDDAHAAIASLGETSAPVRTRAAANLAEALLEHGDLDSAAMVLDQVRGQLVAFDVLAALASARVALARGHYAEALAELGAAAQSGEANPALAPWRSLAAECHVMLGEPDLARTLATEELALAREICAPAAEARALRALARASHGRQSLNWLAEAARILADTPLQLERARTLVDLGLALSASDEPTAARDSLRRAMGIAHSCGATALAARARDALIAAGGRPRKPINDGLDGLTRAERAVAELAAAGRTNREIGEELYVTLNTVSTHLRSVYRKLNINSRAQLPTP